MDARYEKGRPMEGLGVPHHVYDASGEMRATVWSAKEAKALVARINQLGGTPTSAELHPAGQAYKQRYKQEIAERQARRERLTVQGEAQQRLRERLTGGLAVRAAALRDVVVTDNDVDGIGAMQRAQDCLRLAQDIHDALSWSQ